jgi:hypothetical protein
MLRRRHDARATLEEAVHLCKQPAEDDPDPFRDQLAESLTLLSIASGSFR